MDDASLAQACVEILAGGDVARAVAAVAPVVERQVRAVAARNESLFREARLEPPDGAQEVMRR